MREAFLVSRVFLREEIVPIFRIDPKQCGPTTWRVFSKSDVEKMFAVVAR
jgi:hypothetical protein